MYRETQDWILERGIFPEEKLTVGGPGPGNTPVLEDYGKSVVRLGNA